MVVDFHGQEGGRGAAQDSKKDDPTFGNSPFVLAGFGFVGSVGEVSYKVDQKQVDQE